MSMHSPGWKELRSRAEVTAQPTPTVLAGSFNAGPFDDQGYVEIINDDGSQLVSAYIEFATAEAGPWWQSSFEGLAEIGPSESRHAKFEVRACPFWRVRGTASGAGAACRITVRVLQRGT